MRYVVTGEQMRKADQYTIQTIGIPSVVLMERAAYSVVLETLREMRPGERILAVCGTGNNGADGIAAARILFIKGYQASILLVGDSKKGTEEYKQQLKVAQNLGMEIFSPQDDWHGGGILLDALFGAGLSRDIGGDYKEVIEQLTLCPPRFTLAVDIPSGIHADNGIVMGTALKADITVAFGYEKLGCVLYPGRSYAGRVVVHDIGVPLQSLLAACPSVFVCDIQDCLLIPRRMPYSNKGTYGKVLIVAGSRNMSGAAYLSALAAYQTGAGLVKILTVEANRMILQEQLPEAIIETYEEDEAREKGEIFCRRIEKACAWASVIVLGPGLGRQDYVEPLVEAVLSNAYVPIILDADGLNTIAQNPELTIYYTENIIVTPHMGEMARLVRKPVDEIQEDPVKEAGEYRDMYGITCVLKDAATVAALKDGRTYVNTSGNSGLAKAGSGDILTGMIAGLIAIGMEETNSVVLGVYLHGLAGDAAKEKRGEHGILARDIAYSISEVMKQK